MGYSFLVLMSELLLTSTKKHVLVLNLKDKYQTLLVWSDVLFLHVQQKNPNYLHVSHYRLDSIHILTVCSEHTDYKNTCLSCKFHSTSWILNTSILALNHVRLFRLSLSCLSDSSFTNSLRGIRLRISFCNWTRQSLVRALR